MTALSIKTVSVFAGSSMGNKTVYAEEMKRLAGHLAQMGKEIWVGGYAGMTKILVDEMLTYGGEIRIFQPPHYAVGRNFPEGATVIPVPSDRARIDQLVTADAWITAPGSAGTITETAYGIGVNLDRTYMIPPAPLTPHFILNVAGIHKSLIGAYRHAVDAGFGRPETMQLFTVAANADELAHQMAAMEGECPRTLQRVSSTGTSPTERKPVRRGAGAPAP